PSTRRGCGHASAAHATAAPGQSSRRTSSTRRSRPTACSRSRTVGSRELPVAVLSQGSDTGTRSTRNGVRRRIHGWSRAAGTPDRAVAVLSLASDPGTCRIRTRPRRAGMNAIALLLAKDARVLARSRLLAVGLVVYPLLIALVVGVLVRYAGERPEVSLVGEDALPSIVHVGNTSFDFRQRLADATEVKLVSRTPAEASRELDSGRALATLVIPPDFVDRLGSMQQSPKVTLITTRNGLSSRVVEKIRSLVYRLNLELQQAYITANLAAVDLLLKGGSGNIGK